MRRGFTLVELLIVIVIIGVMAALIGPTFTGGSDVARVKTASRAVIQLSRYARTMALLRQTSVDLVYGSDGSLRVEQAGGVGESIVSAQAFSSTNREEEAASAAAAAAEAEAPAAPEEKGGGGASYEMADLELSRTFDGVTFRFEGYSDVMDDGRGGRLSKAARSEASEPEEEAREDEVRAFRLRYKSNGTCRPYSVRIASGEESGFSLTVVIDVLGSAKVEEEE